METTRFVRVPEKMAARPTAIVHAFQRWRGINLYRPRGAVDHNGRRMENYFFPITAPQWKTRQPPSNRIAFALPAGRRMQRSLRSNARAMRVIPGQFTDQWRG